MRIGDLIERRARIAPEWVFWESPAGNHTYGALDAAANRVAHALRAAGLRPGAHAAICAPNGYAYACAHFGAAKAGVVLAHLNARFTASELLALLQHSDAALLFAGTAQAERLPPGQAGPPGLRQVVRLPAEHEAAPVPALGGLPLPGIAWEEWLAPHPTTPLPEAPPGDDGAPFQLLYTSGTTGAPKGALIPHRAKVRQGTTHALNLGLMPGDRILSALPLYHQYAQWLLFASAPIAGATVVARPAFDAADCWAHLASGAITHLPLVPTTLYRLLDAPGTASPALRCIVYGGAPIDPGRIPAVRARFPGVRLFQGFGQTEAGYCLGLMDADHDHHPHSLGRPDLFSTVRLLDADGDEVAPGAVGEIVARTPYLMQGYYKDPQATAAYFAFGKAWGRTGDLAVRDADGYYTLVGRTRELIISGGVNVYPAEVERVLQQHPDVADAAVVRRSDAEWGEVVVAAVVPRSGSVPSAQELDAHCRAVLADFKCPRDYRFLADLPRTHSGKVQKHLLQARAFGEPVPEAGAPGGDSGEPPTPTTGA